MTELSLNNNSDEVPLPLVPVVFLLLDGWGIAPPSEANAITSVTTPTFFSLIKNYPVATLDTQNLGLNDRYYVMGTGCSLVDQNKEDTAARLVTLTSLIAEAGLKQIKITESERLAALTHFFNGRSDNKAVGEDLKILSSETNDYAAKSRLTILRLTREIVRAVEGEKYNFIAAVIPTIDLAAATGDMTAAQAAVVAVDKSLKKIISAVLNKQGVVMISAAGGNAEKIKDLGTDLVDKEMTNNPVPFIIVSEEFKGQTIGLAEPLNNDLSLLAPAGTLADLAPTILQLLKLNVPVEMNGHSLID